MSTRRRCESLSGAGLSNAAREPGLCAQRPQLLSPATAPRPRPPRSGDWFKPLGYAVVLLVALQVLDLDRSVSDLFYDPVAARFPLKNNWWLTHVFHNGAKWVVVVFGVVLLAIGLASFASARLRRCRAVAFFLVFAMALSSFSVSALKHFSAHACPYDLALYGGSAPRLAFLERLPEGTPPGQCWPGGHAATAFSLFGLYFAARQRSRRVLALSALAFVLLFGIALSLTQTMRGAHFLSHQVWTAVICWYVTALVHHASTGLGHEQTGRTDAPGLDL